MAFFQNNKLRLHFEERGSGLPFIFQHGLGADTNQPHGLFKPPAGIRLIAFDARGHGHSETGPAERLSFSTSADDLLALMEHLGLSGSVVGGVSMGAAIALNFASRYPDKTFGLVLSRPAWLDGPNPFNQRIFGVVAGLISTVGTEEGLRLFQKLPEIKELKRDFPDTSDSLCNQFKHPRALEMAENLTRIPNDSPLKNLEQLRSFHCPTLILANKKDPIHPYEYGVKLAAMIPGAQFRELTPKSVNLDRHLKEVQQGVEEFLTQAVLLNQTYKVREETHATTLRHGTVPSKSK